MRVLSSSPCPAYPIRYHPVLFLSSPCSALRFRGSVASVLPANANEYTTYSSAKLSSFLIRHWVDCDRATSCARWRDALHLAVLEQLRSRWRQRKQRTERGQHRQNPKDLICWSTSASISIAIACAVHPARKMRRRFSEATLWLIERASYGELVAQSTSDRYP